MIYIVNLSLLIIFVFLDYHNLNSNIFKLITSINLILYLYYQNKRIPFLISICAFLGDFVLLYTNYYNLGILFFILVQAGFSMILKQHPYYLIITPFLFPYTVPLAIIYALISCINIYYSQHYFRLAIICLALCDTIIALKYLELIDLQILVWIFYVTGQLLFVRSLKEFT